MKISVVTVSLNSEATIAGTIASFLSQSYPDKELLIIDGLSQDCTLEVVQRFRSPHIRWVSQKDRGIFYAMNKAFALYDGDAIGFLNSNDQFHDPRALERIATGLKQAEAVHGGLLMVRDHQKSGTVRTWTGTPFKRGKFRWGWMPPHPTFYIRRSLADKVGQFDLRYEIAADYDYMLRALEFHATSTFHISDPLVNFLVGGKSSGSLGKVLKGNLECLRSRREHFGGPPIDLAFFLKPGLKAVQQHVIFEGARRIVARTSPKASGGGLLG